MSEQGENLLDPGQIIDGKYEVIQKLGTGGMGEVYQVRHVHLLDTRVIKVMRPNVAASDTERKRFLAEARLATQIQSENVAILYDFAQLPNGSFYMVWEYIPGKNLYEILQTCGAMPIHLVKNIALQALNGLANLHKTGIIHRDISPENIMLFFNKHDELRVKIIDLGIAKSSQAEERLTQTGMFMGKLKYCSPEQVGMLPEGEHLDARTDIYSFGIVLYEMVVGAAPFASTTPYGYIHKHTAEQPPPINLIDNRRIVQDELNQVIMRALAKKRDDRYENAANFIISVDHLPQPDSEQDNRSYFQSLGGVETLCLESTGSTQISGDLESTPTHIVQTPSRPQPMADRSRLESTPTQLVTPSKPQPMPQPEKKKRSPMVIIGPIILVVVIGIAAVLFLKFGGKETPPLTSEPGTIALYVSPWAEILTLQSEDGTDVPLDEKVTPLFMNIQPGQYTVTLKPPDGESFQKTFTVQPGKRTVITHQAPHTYDEFLAKIR